ncbi:Rhodanese-like domain-containing protein [Lasiosphaeris hirsuta]|uniref:Rhodanese-like domain-containing protein n=1 Tax=Lasiosphaeris hirsuta TaxID=260670 RepID=A0AA40DVK6_9PEZI|nr:Rhodanese-like domain-containing protein [Lasiosphaeris hirsuta]
MATIGTLPRLSAAALSELILAEQAVAKGDPTIAIIDVRDDDYIGGHIKGAQNIPSRTLETMLPTLIRQHKDKEIIVFHCALSQQRGPGAALRYIRERERALSKQQKATKANTDGANEEQATKPVEQKIYVLDKGFVGWQEVYGTDERLTEGYRKELWADGYWG